MPVDAPQLPKDPKKVAGLVWRHAIRCESQLMHRRTNWLLAWYYLNGYRRFDVFDPTSGQLQAHLLDAEGKMEYQNMDLLYNINQVAGRLQSMDLRLKVDQQGFSLESQRNRAMAQIVGDAIVNEDQLRTVADEFSWTYSCLGSAGLHAHVEDHPYLGLVGDIEVVHPKEIFPFPALGQDITKLRGIMRRRWVPLDYLENIYGKRKITGNIEDMEWYETEAGDSWADREGTNDLGFTGLTKEGGSPSLEASSREKTPIVRINELWMLGPHYTTTRYIVTSGEHTLQDDDLSDMEVYCPLGFARFWNNGTFHGAGLFDMMFGVNRQLELLRKSLFNNIRDLDRYGILVLPQGQFNQNHLLKDVGRGLRVMFWEPDAIAEGFNPFPIQPYNAGDMPGRVAQYAQEALSALNPIQDLLKEKGRVDSATGLQFLEEQVTKALTTPTMGIQSCFGSMYRALVQRAITKLSSSPRALPVGSLTLDLAGAIIDTEKNEVSFSNNPLPRISGLTFGIRALSPRSQLARKQEALQLWQMGIEQDPLAFRMFAAKEGLDYAMWKDEDAPAYEASIRTILTAFGDGMTGGQIIVTPYTTRPDILLRLLSGFLTSPICQHASSDVLSNLRTLRLTALNYMGLVLPAAMPNPDDAALLSQPPSNMMPGQMQGQMPEQMLRQMPG